MLADALTLAFWRPELPGIALSDLAVAGVAFSRRSARAAQQRQRLSGPFAMANYTTDDRTPQPPRPGSVRRIGLLLRNRWPLRFASSTSLVDVAAVHASHAVGRFSGRRFISGHRDKDSKEHRGGCSPALQELH